MLRRAALSRFGAGALASGLASGVLAACASGASGSAGAGEAPRAGSAASGSVTWMCSANPATSGFDRIEAAFRTEYPQIALDVQHVPDDYDNKLLALYSAGNPPDVLRLNDDYVLGYETRTLIAPLDRCVRAGNQRREDFYPAVYDFPVSDGKPYAWFLGANPRLVFYNVDLLMKEGIPLPPAKWEPAGWTFDDFAETARKLTRTQTPPGVYGASFYDDTGNEQTLSINNGSPTGIFSKDGRQVTLADPPGYAAIQWIADLANRHRVQPTRQVASDRNGAAGMFVNEQLAMWFTSTGSISRLRRDTASTWDVTPTPMRARRLMEASIQTYALAAGAKNPDNGWRPLQFFTDEEVARIFIDNGYVIPARRTFAEDYVAANRGKPPASTELVVESFNHQTQPNQTLDTQRARRIYRGNNLNEIRDGVGTAKDGLTRVRAQVEAVIAPK